MERWNTNFDADELLSIFRTRHNYSTEQLAKVGAIILSSAVLEHELELTLWQMGLTASAGAKPKTDAMPATERIDELAKIAVSLLGPGWQPAIEDFAAIGKSVIEYRNAVAHGYPAGATFGAKSRANFSWIGELRGRPIKVAIIDDSNLDVMLAAMNVIIQSLYEARDCEPLLAAKLIVSRAHSSGALAAIRAIELRAE